MKTRQLSTVVSATALLVGWLSTPSQAQVNPVVGDWDLTIGGTARGVAQLTFNDDGTISGLAHLQTLKKVPAFDPRGQSNRTEGTNEPPAAVTNFFGSATIDGQWAAVSSGRLIGFINESSQIITATTTNTTTNSVTHSVSFHAVVRGGTSPRLTISGVGPLGGQTFTGIPLQAQTDISGMYLVTGKLGHSEVVEMLTLTPMALNLYTVQGSGPGFTYSGEAILSGRGKLSMVTTSEYDVDDQRVLVFTEAVGGFSTKSLTGTLHGQDSNGRVSLHLFQ